MPFCYPSQNGSSDRHGWRECSNCRSRLLPADKRDLSHGGRVPARSILGVGFRESSRQVAIRMAKERLKRRIAEALAGPSVRDELQRVLRDDASRPDPIGAADPLPAILDNVKDPIVTVSRDGVVLGANAAATRVLAVTVDAVVGRALSEFIPQLAPAGPAL